MMPKGEPNENYQRKNTKLPEDWVDAAKQAVKVIQQGGVILYPTDTIWGIGCDATNEEAVERIFAIKNRPSNKAMLLLIDNDAKLQGLVSKVPSMAYELIDMAIKPLTIIYPGARNVAPQLIPPEGTIGIRITHEPFSNLLCKLARVPLVSTSANISGSPSPDTFLAIDSHILSAVDYVVPIRQDETTPHTPSDIIMLGPNNEVKVIR